MKTWSLFSFKLQQFHEAALDTHRAKSHTTRMKYTWFLLMLLCLMGCEPLEVQVTPSVMPPVRPSSTPLPTTTQAATPVATQLHTPTPIQVSAGSFDLLAVLKPEWTLNAVQDFSVAVDGSLWLATDRSFLRLDADGTHPSQTVFLDTLLGLDSAGRGWVLSVDETVIRQWDGTVWTDYDARHGWAPISPLFRGPLQPQLLTDISGQTWLATAWDVRRFDGARWLVFNAEEMKIALPYRKALATTFRIALGGSANSVWVGGCDWQEGKPVGGGGLSYFDGSDWKAVLLPPGVRTGCISALQAGTDGQVWVGLDASLWAYDPSKKSWRQYIPPPLANDTSRYTTLDIQVAPGGEPWVTFSLCNASGCGLLQARARLRSDGWVWEDTPAANLPEVVWDGSGQGWRLGADGAIRLDGVVDAILPVRAVVLGDDGRLRLLAEYDSQLGAWVGD